MPFDPCGTRTLDGDEIIDRLAKALNTNPIWLREALYKIIANSYPREKL